MGNYFLTASRWEADSSETYQQGCRTRQRTPESASCICKCFAVWCPGATSATEGASYNGNGAAWHKDSPKHWSACVLIPRIPLGSSELILGEKKNISCSSSASLQGESMLQPNVPIPVLVVCFSVAAARLISLWYSWLLECSQPRKELSHKAWGPYPTHQRVMVLRWWQP